MSINLFISIDTLHYFSYLLNLYESIFFEYVRILNHFYTRFIYDLMHTSKHCSICSKSLICSSDSGQCWCMNFSTLIDVKENQDCLCEKCLKHQIKEQVDTYCAKITIENASQNNDRALSRSSELIEDIDYYIEKGLYVFTKWFHLKRGTCCKNSCRHCPYGFKK